MKASVRALDKKGGRHLALELELGNEALELRAFKRRLGARLAAAGTSASMLPAVRSALERLLGEHPRLLEGGLRRFLKRAIQLVSALEAGFEGASKAAELARASLAPVRSTPQARACAAVRLARGFPRRFEAIPGFARRNGRADFAALVDGSLVTLTALVLPRRKLAGKEDWGDVAVSGGLESAGVVADIAANAALEAAAEAGGSCLSDAACAGIDCGGLDCIPF